MPFIDKMRCRNWAYQGVISSIFSANQIITLSPTVINTTFHSTLQHLTFKIRVSYIRCCEYIFHFLIHHTSSASLDIIVNDFERRSVVFCSKVVKIFESNIKVFYGVWKALRISGGHCRRKVESVGAVDCIAKCTHLFVSTQGRVCGDSSDTMYQKRVHYLSLLSDLQMAESNLRRIPDY